MIGGPGSDVMVGGDPCDGDLFDGGTGNDNANFFRFTPGVTREIGGAVSRTAAGCTPGRIDARSRRWRARPGPTCSSATSRRQLADRQERQRRPARPRRRRSRSPAVAGNDRPDRRPRPRRELPVIPLRPADSPPRRAAARNGRARSPRLAGSSPRRWKTVSMSASPAATGTTRRPPSASWPSSVRGGRRRGRRGRRSRRRGPARAGRGCRRRRSARRCRCRAHRARAGLARRATAWRSMPITSAARQRQHRGRVAGPVPISSTRSPPPSSQRLADRGDDPGLGDRLALADRQRRVGVGAAARSRSGTNSSRGTAPIAASTRSSSISRRRSCRSTIEARRAAKSVIASRRRHRQKM